MPIFGRLQCRVAPFAVLFLLSLGTFKSYDRMSMVMVEASFIGGQRVTGSTKGALENKVPQSKYLANPAHIATNTVMRNTMLAYRPLPDDLISEQAPPSYDKEVDALKALLDETVSVYMDSSRSAQAPGAEDTTNATQAQEIQTLIQEMNHALQFWENDHHIVNGASEDAAKIEQGTRFEVSLLLEQATRRYVDAVNRGDHDVATEQHQRMQALAARFKKLPKSNEERTTAAEQRLRSETTSLASFQARLEQIKRHLPQATTTVEQQQVEEIPEYQNRKMQSTGKPKADLPEIAFQERDIPDPELLQEMLYQATTLFDRCDEDYYSGIIGSGIPEQSTVPITKQVQELVEDIGHVLYYAIRSFEKQKEKATALEGQRTRVKVAQEVEAALQLHMKIGDDLSEEILRELAMEFRAMAPDVIDEDAVPGTAVVSALEERIHKLQQKLGVKKIALTQQYHQDLNLKGAVEEHPKESPKSVSEWDCWSGLSTAERRNQLVEEEEIPTSLPALDLADGVSGLQALLDRSTFLLARCGLSEHALDDIQTLVDDIAQALYFETKYKRAMEGSSSLLSLQSRFEKLEKEIQIGPSSKVMPDQAVAPAAGKTEDISALPAKDKESKVGETLSPRKSEETSNIMVDNSTLISSIPSPQQSDYLGAHTTKMSPDSRDSDRLNENVVARKTPEESKLATTSKSKGAPETTKAIDSSETVAWPKQKPLSSKKDSVRTEKSKATTSTEPVVDRVSLESWLDATGSNTSPSQPSSSKVPTSTEASGKPKPLNAQAGIPALSDAEWKENVKADLKKLYTTYSKSSSEDKSSWQLSLEADLQSLHASNPPSLSESALPMEQNEIKNTRDELKEKENVQAPPKIVSKPAVSGADLEEHKADVDDDVLEALSEAESALEYADVADVSIAERINERMGGIVSKTTDTVLDVTLRGAFFFASKALDAATNNKYASQQDSPDRFLDIFKRKKGEKSKSRDDTPTQKDNDDSAVPFFATVKNPDKSRKGLFSPHPPEVPPPVKSKMHDDDFSPHTNTTSGSKSNGRKVSLHGKQKVSAFESKQVTSPLQGLTKLFGPKSALFSSNEKNDSDDDDHPPRDALLPSTTLFYHSHSFPRVSRRGLLLQAHMANSNIDVSTRRQIPLSTIISALVYPFLLQRVKPTLMLGALIIQCIWMLRLKPAT